jgi:hypothetical protein
LTHYLKRRREKEEEKKGKDNYNFELTLSDPSKEKRARRKMLIDTSIRDWVLFPLLLLVVLVHFIRAFLMKIISSETRVDSTEMQQK